MATVGTVESLWRYPVKSMRGEEMGELFAGYAGVYGDRLFAFESSANDPGFPFFTGRDQSEMIRYRPRFRHPAKVAQPANWNAAQKLSPNITPISASPDDLMIDVETPDGKSFAIDDPKLIAHLRANSEASHQLKLLRSEKAMVDCRPVSLISIQTIAKLSDESGVAPDKRRFRANIYLDLKSSRGFVEDEFVGKSLRIGSTAVVQVLHRDGRCAMVTIDPDTAKKSPAILKAVAQNHNGLAGVYAAVLTEGVIRKDDTVELLSD
jgi:uncharacterized protein